MSKSNEKGKDYFRDNLATIDKEGKRVWVYAKKPKGRLTTYRYLTGAFLLIVFFVIPFLKINGQPVFLLNFIERRFLFFGITFWPQDFHLFFLAMISFMVFIILFTVIYGRIWCGWACPQTVFLEFIFRPIEWLIDGKPSQQRKLSKQKWNFEKIWKRSLKHTIFFAISFIISNTLLTYIIGIEHLKGYITGEQSIHFGELAGMLVFSGIFYFVFSWFREQVCTIVCPYGRLQGVLLDKKSIIVAYDYKRGEPRGAFRKSEDRAKEGKGHCINCTQCVQVCPTGIDIRNGTQLECINCTACIDACNSQMDAVKQPRGLIRYTSEKNISEGTKVKFNARVIAYSAVLVILLGVVTFSLVSRSDVEATILRAPGLLYQEQPNNRISNLYNIKLVNKTNEHLAIDIKLLSHNGEIQIIGKDIIVKAQTVGESVFFVILNKDDVLFDKVPIELGIYSDDQLIQEVKSVFNGPNIAVK